MSRNYRRPRPKASRIFEQRFDLPGVTTFGGINELGRFLLKLKVEKRLAECFRDAKSPWSAWRLDRVIRVLLDAYFRPWLPTPSKRVLEVRLDQVPEVSGALDGRLGLLVQGRK